MKTIIKRPVKLLLTTAVFLTPAVFGNSQAVLRADESSFGPSALSACESLYSFPASTSSSGLSACESLYSFPATTSSAVSGWREAQSLLDSVANFGAVKEDREKSAGGEQPSSAPVADVAAAVVDASKKEESALLKLVAKHAGTAAYQAIYPKIKESLERELNKLFYATGQVVLMPNGEKLPVLNDPSKGFVDAILCHLGANSIVRFGVKNINLLGIISGKKAEVEANLQSALGFNSLDTFAEFLAQEITLKAMGIAVNASQAPAVNASQAPAAVNAAQASAPRLSLSEIANVQQHVSLKDGRADLLSERATEADLEFAKNYLLYEIKNMLNNFAAIAIRGGLDELKKQAVRTSKEKINSVVNMAAFCAVKTGPMGRISALGLMATNQLYGATVIEAVYGLLDQFVIDGMLAVRNIAVLPITQAEIEQYHAVVTTVNTTDEDDTIVVNSVEEDSYANRFVFGRAAPAVEVVGGAAKAVANGVAGGVKKIASWFWR